MDAGADTKTTTKMWKRKNKGKKKQVISETHTWIRGPRGLGFSHGLDPPNPPNPQPQREDIEPPDAG